MRTVGSAVQGIGRWLGLAGAAIVLVTGAAACAKTVTGAAQPATSVVPSAASAPQGSASAAPPSSALSPSQQAQQTCSQLPKTAVTSAFGVTGVVVTADSGTMLTGGILQIKCVISGQGGFRANAVVQIYPSAVLSDANQYLQIMQSKFPGVRTITVSGADVAGLFQQSVNGGLVDEAFAAKKDASTSTVDVVLAGVADSPGIDPKLITFITALANS